MSEDRDDLREPMAYWPDLLTAAIATAPPGSGLANEFVRLAIRAKLDESDSFFVAADVASVMAEQGVTAEALAETLMVPPIFIYGVMRGWHRLSIRGLAMVAEAMEVPISAFMLDADDRPRLDVRRFHAYHSIAPMVTILGD